MHQSLCACKDEMMNPNKARLRIDFMYTLGQLKKHETESANATKSGEILFS